MVGLNETKWDILNKVLNLKLRIIINLKSH